MKFDLTQSLLDPYGEPLKDGDDDVTLGLACANAFIKVMPQDQELSIKQKLEIYEMAMKLGEHIDGEIDLAFDEIATVRKRVGEMYTAIVVGAVYALMDLPKEKPKK